MTQQNFPAWAHEHGLLEEIVEQLTTFASTPEELQFAIDAVEVGPPIYPLDAIRELHEGDDIGIAPAKHGFMIVGGCPNGDPIALDIADQPGSVWYLDHETMHRAPLRSVAIRVADDLENLIDSMSNNDEFPIDYDDAKDLPRAG